MSKIELNEKEKAVIQEYFDGKLSMFGSTEEQMEVMTGVIDKAEALMFELNAFEESGEDIIVWFWDKYRSQEQSE